MKKNILCLLFACLALFMQACTKINGEGPTVTQTYSLSNFSSVHSSIDADVYISQGTDYKVEISAQQNVLDAMETTVSGNELNLQYKSGKIIWHHSAITVHITMPVVNGMSISGSGNIRAMNVINSNALTLKISGSGNISIASYIGGIIDASISGSGNIKVSSGQASSETIHISGSGDIDMLNLSCTDAYTHISGSGNATLTANNSLDVHISGSGDVSYSGTPKVNTSISGSGRLRHI